MAKHENILLLVADGEHARFVRFVADKGLQTERSLSSDAAHKRAADLGTDRPGASCHSDSTARHALAPRQDLHAQEKRYFAHALARELNALCHEGSADKLVIVAPERVLQDVRSALDQDATKRVAGLLTKDLVKTPDGELLPHVRQWLPPVRRPH
jgi:protein required for attachment to host cells